MVSFRKRQSLGNGTLYFPPFRAQDYRKDVHTTQYRCRATNIVGTIVSRDVNVRAVLQQHYEVQVYRSHVLTGNTAVLSCVIPSYVKDHVTVTSWFRDDTILQPGWPDIECNKSAIGTEDFPGGRYVMISGSGDLHIRSARMEDGQAKYSCRTLHSLTQELKRSSSAMLTVTDPTGSMPPRLAPRTNTAITAESGSDVHLCCSAQGNPPPNFTWYREVSGQMQTVIPSSRIIMSHDILYIRRVEPEDSGKWSCKTSNQFGEQRLDIHLVVTAHLSVHIVPKLQIVNSGETAMFNCTVTGSPVSSAQWLRNGSPLIAGTAESGGRIRLAAPFVLAVGAVTRHDRGMYQCVVGNERESAEGSAELRLGDTIPELQWTFIDMALRPGPYVSLRCAATGSPPPQFKWLLDGNALSELTAGHRYAIGQYVDQVGDVISHLNISDVRVEDGGLYSCRAVNSLGSAIHSSRLNIYGSPFIRSVGPVSAVAGTDVTLHCPYSGYPISSVRWERRGQELPGDLRHKVEDSTVGGSLIISRLDPVTDAGSYTCTVTSRSGEMARRDMQLIVHSPPVLEPFTFPTSLQEGSRAQVTCSVTSGDLPIQITWHKDNAPVSSTLQIDERSADFYSILIFKEVNSRHSGFYTCIASNSAARANYTAQLMVKVAPQWIIEPQDVSTLLGNSVMINCEAKGFPHPQISWLKGKGKVSLDYKPIQSSRTVLLANGSMWIEVVSPQDEGHYLCRATNGIGSGLSKVLYIGVNEPARFESPAKNISSKRGDPVSLICQVYGDSPIEVIWFHNGNRLDVRNYRFTITEIKSENGLKTQLSIARTDREDSGVYRCQAENAFGRSEHLIHLAVQERPDPPMLLEVVEVGSRTVRLTWRRSFDGNSPVSAYMVQYQALITGHDTWDHSEAINITLALNSITRASNEDEMSEVAEVKGLSPATAYTMRMLAVNSIDQSSFSESVVVKTQEEAPLDAPQNLQVKSVGQGELFLSWQVPHRDTWNGELLGYIVTWNEQGNPINNSKSMTVKGWATTKVQLTGLRKFTRYDVTIKAYNSVSAGPSSISVVGTTQEGVPEAAPQHVSCSKITSQSMKVSWHPPPASQHGGLIQGYKVFYRPIASENVDLSSGGEIKRTSSTETYLHALQKFTNYSIKVLAYTNAGDGTLSLPLHCNTEEDVPGPPANIKASTLTGDSILVSWLPPTRPNGRIGIYTVYAREAGRVGQHVNHVVRVEETSVATSPSSGPTVATPGLMYEVRGLKELQLYEFWVSATTNVGEGEPTPIIAQSTNVKAPSRIASFSQLIARPVKSNVLLPCVAVGNPRPRTLWMHRERPITFSPFYEVTPGGHLNIHGADPSLAGNYTCSAKNLFGEDEITYSLVVLLPPSQPVLEVQYTTTNSVKLKWKHSDDGGATIQGYTLSIKKGSEDWKNLELSPETFSYTFEDLQCGSTYNMFLTAHNRVGDGSPSHTITVSTKGGAPQIARDTDIIMVNSSTLQLNLFAWPNGGCPIMQFSVEYKILGEDKWMLVSNSVSEEKLLIQELMPGTWYQLRVTAENDAGLVSGVYHFATLTTTGARVPYPPNFSENPSQSSYEYTNSLLIVALIIILILILCGIFFWYSTQKKRRIPEVVEPQEEETVDEKTIERDNRRNCQQMYSSSPLKTGDKIKVEDVAGMYEISPYATFSVPGNNSRSVTTSTLDYTMQFKTFGHLENEDHNAVTYPKCGDKRNWHHKHRYYNTVDHRVRQQQIRMRGERTPHRADSESEDTSGSPCYEHSGPGASNYRVPVKHARDIFRLDSSTESNEVSPMTERRHTPRHIALAGGRRERERERDRHERPDRSERHRPSSSTR